MSIPFAISLIAAALSSTEAAPVQIRRQDQVASIENCVLRVDYDLTKGTWSAIDKRRGHVIISAASSRADRFTSIADGASRNFIAEPLSDALGMGQSLLVTTAVPGGPKLLLRISLYDDHGFIALAAGLDNSTGQVIQLKEVCPLQGEAFAGFDTQSGYRTLDGFSGGAKTYVAHDGRKRKSLNNMLMTFGFPGGNRSLVLGGLSYEEFEKYTEVERRPDAIAVHLAASDPVGKRIDPGVRYLVDKDRFYIDFLTDNPFEALETYADRVRLAQPVELPVCRFPIVDTWFAQVPHFGGGEDRAGYRAQNDSVGAVEEMECVVRTGFLRYSTVGVLLEPDLYDLNNQQGWWDDAHWQRGPSNRAKRAGTWGSSHGQFVPPYETARKWCGAVKALGGIPMIYVQTGFRSQDYAEQFPGHMLFNEPNASHLDEKGRQQYRDKEKKQPRKLGYDYTDPGLHAPRPPGVGEPAAGRHPGREIRLPRSAVYRLAGARRHGRPRYATTAMHYRNVFRLPERDWGPIATCTSGRWTAART